MTALGDRLLEVAAIVGGVLTLVAAFRLGWTGLTARVRRTDKIDELLGMTDDLATIVTRELTHNHGTSMKDDLHGLALAQRASDERLDRLEAHVGIRAEAEPAMWRAVEAIANAQPPEDT